MSYTFSLDMPARVIIRLLSGFASDLSSSTKIKMTGETQELRSDKRKPREDRQNNRYHRYHGSYRYDGSHRHNGSHG